jgi:hypothetical protein
VFYNVYLPFLKIKIKQKNKKNKKSTSNDWLSRGLEILSWVGIAIPISP